jgi:hypothetical protein
MPEMTFDRAMLFEVVLASNALDRINSVAVVAGSFQGAVEAAKEWMSQACEDRDACEVSCFEAISVSKVCDRMICTSDLFRIGEGMAGTDKVGLMMIVPPDIAELSPPPSDRWDDFEDDLRECFGGGAE